MERYPGESEGIKTRQERMAAFLMNEGLSELTEAPVHPLRPEFVDHPINPEATEMLLPDSLRRFFEQRGLRSESAIPLKQGTRTTLFPVAAIQKLEPIFYEDSARSSEPMLIAQPVIRTQFLGRVSEGISTSFVNLATEHVDATLDDHFTHIQEWLRFLNLTHLKNEDIQYHQKTSMEKWNARDVPCEVVKFYFQNMEIGDGVYIPAFPQNERIPLRVSDVGFGRERIEWILRGGNYFSSEQDTATVDAANTLALIAVSGIQPGNKGREYRHRLFSKRLVQSAVSGDTASALLSAAYEKWLPWITAPMSFQEMSTLIGEEYNRNLRRSLLGALSLTHTDIDIDINEPSDVFFEGLKGTSVNLKEIRLLEQEYEKRKL